MHVKLKYEYDDNFYDIEILTEAVVNEKQKIFAIYVLYETTSHLQHVFNVMELFCRIWKYA